MPAVLPKAEQRRTPHAAEPVSLRLDASVVAQRVRNLPALPAALGEVLLALQREDLRTDRCAQLIERDQALSGRTLRLANSSFYGMSGRVGTIRDAIQMLGLRTVSTMMTTAMLINRFNASACPEFNFRAFWRHSIGVSIAARELARASGLNEGRAAIAGLMHDVGQLAMATHFAQPLRAALALARSTDRPLAEVEQELLGLDHAQVGGMVARHWGLPADIAAAIERHHANALLGPPDASTWLCDTVHLADATAHALNLSGDVDEVVPPLSLDAWERLRAASLPMASIFTTIETDVQALCEALGL